MNNDNKDIKYNDFKNQPLIPYKILEALLTNTSESANRLFKLLKYNDIDCLSKPNLTLREKKSLIWRGQDIEQNYNIFVKPLIGSSLVDSESQSQMRIYRYSTYPTNKIEATISIQMIFLTNEKSSLVEVDGILCERTDVMESEFLNIINGRDISIGSGYITFDREVIRSSTSQINVSNSRSVYGRSLLIALKYTNLSHDIC